MDGLVDVELHDLRKSFGGLVAVDGVSLQIQRGEFFSLLGPSGCGKTTLLRMIAGFEHPSEGTLVIQGKPMAGTPPFARNVNTVFQQYALFPHMTVAENVGFGLRMKRVPGSEAKRRVAEAIELVRLSGLESRRPRELSGGQQQRVALARALVNRPAVLLLDEPLGALDLKLRKEMQFELKRLQATVGITFVYVTHDQEEALTMSDRIAVMRTGSVLQVGTAAAIYERPVNRFVADFIGEMNFFDGVVRGVDRDHLIVDGANGATIRVESGRVASERAVATGDRVTIAIRPEHVEVAATGCEPRDGTSAISGVVEQVVYAGADTAIEVRISDQHVIRARKRNTPSPQQTWLPPGAPAVAWWPSHCALVLTD